MFISVLKALDIDENISLFGTLISFGSNLCFGKYMTRFRELLKKDFKDLMDQIIKMIIYVNFYQSSAEFKDTWSNSDPSNHAYYNSSTQLQYQNYVKMLSKDEQDTKQKHEITFKDHNFNLTSLNDSLKKDQKELEEIKELKKKKKMSKREKKNLEEREKVYKKKVGDRILLKQTLCGFIANLTLDGTFRNYFANEEFLGHMMVLLQSEQERK